MPQKFQSRTESKLNDKQKEALTVKTDKESVPLTTEEGEEAILRRTVRGVETFPKITIINRCEGADSDSPVVPLTVLR